MLLDTSGLMCLLDNRDHRHAEAARLYQTARLRLTTNYVLAEYVALAHVRGMSRQQTLAFSAAILNDPNVEIIWVEEPRHRQAVELLLARQDKTYSLCDAVSFVLMRERQILEALTTDKHFAQEGLTRLLTS
jgi:uncharacterized protein